MSSEEGDVGAALATAKAAPTVDLSGIMESIRHSELVKGKLFMVRQAHHERFF